MTGEREEKEARLHRKEGESEAEARQLEEAEREEE